MSEVVIEIGLSLKGPGPRIMKDFRLKSKVLLLLNSLFVINRYLKLHVNEIVVIQLEANIRFFFGFLHSKF